MAPTGSAPPAPFASLEHLTTARVRYVVAFMAIWIYDWLALLPEEREAIWQAKASVGKGLFLFLRYFSLFHVLCSSLLLLLPVSPRICGGMFWLEPFGGMLITFLSLVILSLRVSAIYNQSWTIMTSLSVMLVAIAGWLVYDMTLFAAMQLPAQVADAVHFHGCIAAPRDPSASNVMTSAWAAPLLADSILVVLTLYRSRDLVKRMSSSAVNPPLISKIMSSGVLYYICITSSNLVNTILYSRKRPSTCRSGLHLNLLLSLQASTNAPDDFVP
ncbi:DUF6533 domain-containing protein [Sporobolomyces koalae]|uniref:DUF6533 domain-containing protein n=1 Tax=Sporobolomyces koalae TaxID=500713 RepID=UPI00317B8E07